MRPRGLHYVVVFVLMISASCGAEPELEGETPVETLGNVSAEEGRQELESPEAEEIDLTAAAAAPVANTGERE